MLKIIRYSIFIVSLLIALLIGAKFSESIKMAISNKEEEKINISVPKKEDAKIKLPPLEIEEKKLEDSIKNVPNIPSKNTMDIKNPIETMNEETNIENPTKILDNEIDMEKPLIPEAPIMDIVIEQEKMPENVLDSKEMQKIPSEEIMEETSPLEMENEMQDFNQ